MEHLDYISLYLMQDQVLQLMFTEDTEFYLSGGTCLNRFYYEKRYSDDLDFFTHCSDTFAYSVRAATGLFSQAGLSVKKQIQSRDFIRIMLKNNDGSLQVDFINDRVKRFGDFNYKHGYRLDNPLNILSNKITAVIGRDNPKDIFDIYLIWKNTSFSWQDILVKASEKLCFQKEDLIYRLQLFPVPLLKKLNTTDEHFLDNFEADFNTLIQEIEADG
jgi:hypothetical protein